MIYIQLALCLILRPHRDLARLAHLGGSYSLATFCFSSLTFYCSLFLSLHASGFVVSARFDSFQPLVAPQVEVASHERTSFAAWFVVWPCL